MNKPTDAEILSRADERFKECYEYWDPIHDEWKAEKRFVRCHDEDAQWEPNELKSRRNRKNPRLTLTENLLGPFASQVSNDLKQSDFGTLVLPKDSGTDPQMAEVRSGLHRGIQQIGGFRDALNQCAEDLIDAGVGAFRFITKRRDPKTFRKEIQFIECDPTRVYHGDGKHRKSDMSDVNDSFIIEPYAVDKFKAEFNLDPKNYLGGTQSQVNLWGTDKIPWVTEYFFRTEEPATLVMTVDGTEEYLDDLKAGLKDGTSRFLKQPEIKLLQDLGSLTVEDLIAKDEKGEPITDESTKCQVWYAKLAGKEVLSCEPWPGYFIPVFVAIGRKVSIDGVDQIYGLCKPAFHVQKAHNYAFSALVERAGKAPKTRAWMPVESVVPEYKAVYENLPNHDGMVLYKSMDEKGNKFEKPYQEQPIQSDPAFVNLRQMTLQGIRDVLGMWETSLGAQSQERSGVAIHARERQADTGNFDWGLNLAKAAELCFKAVDEILDKVYDVPTQVRIVGEDDEQEVIMVSAMRDADPQAQGYYDLNRGKYDIICKLSPSADTKRQEQSKGLEMLFQQSPELKVALAPNYLAVQDWKGAKDMAETAKAVRSAQFPGVDFGDGKKQAQLPPQAAQAMQQMQMQVQQLSQQLQQVMPEMERLKLENASIKADKSNDTARVKIEAFKAQVDAESKKSKVILDTKTLELKADQQEHDQLYDGVELNMNAQDKVHEREHAKMNLAMGEKKLVLDSQAKAARTGKPTDGKSGTPSHRET